MIHELPISTCPHCGYSMDRAAPVGDDAGAPDPGDTSICFGCGEILIFDEQLTLRAMTRLEMRRLHVDDPEAWDTLVSAQRLFNTIRARGRTP